MDESPEGSDDMICRLGRGEETRTQRVAERALVGKGSVVVKTRTGHFAEPRPLGV
jgi:hypothetical protein